MRPRLFTAEDSRALFGAFSSLSCFNEAAAIHRGRRDQPGHEGRHRPASMRPRLFTAEDGAAWQCVCRTVRRFNEAAAIHRGRRRRRSVSPRPRDCFNEAAAIHRGRRGRRRSRFARQPRFNEAAAIHRGRRGRSRPARMEVWSASMRPRLFTAEDQRAARRGGVDDRASMRPRLFTAEDLNDRRGNLTLEYSFNEAAAIHRGRPAISSTVRDGRIPDFPEQCVGKRWTVRLGEVEPVFGQTGRVVLDITARTAHDGALKWTRAPSTPRAARSIFATFPSTCALPSGGRWSLRRVLQRPGRQRKRSSAKSSCGPSRTSSSAPSSPPCCNARCAPPRLATRRAPSCATCPGGCGATAWRPSTFAPPGARRCRSRRRTTARNTPVGRSGGRDSTP